MAAGTSPQEFRGLTDEELVTRLRESKEELFNLRFQHATGALENTSQLTLVKRELARLLTIQGEQAEQQEGGAR